MDSAIRWIAHSIFFCAALGLGAQALAAQTAPVRGNAIPSWPQTAVEADGGIVPAANAAGLRLIRFTGRALDAEEQPVTGVAGVTFAIYAEQSGGAPLWQETQTLATDANGHFSALLGAASAEGISPELFAGGESRWLAVLTHAPGAVEQPRILLVSVPYALRAADSEMLGGKPAAAYVTAANAGGGAQATQPATNSAASSATKAASQAVPAITVSGAKAGSLPVFTDTTGDLGGSLLSQWNAGTSSSPVWNMGFGTSTPAFNLNFVSTVDPAAIDVDGYGSTVGINFIGRRAEGTPASPTGLLAGDNIMTMQGRGYGKTGFSVSSRANMKFFASQNWTDTAQGTYITLATTANNTSSNASATERMRIDNVGNVGIGTTTPSHTLSFGGSQANTLGVESNPTAGGAGNSLSISAGAAATGASNEPGGNLILAAGNGTGSAAGGNLHLQTAGDAAGGTAPDTIGDRLLIAGKPKAMTGATPTANLFSLQIATGEAAGGRVKFTIVASDGVNYAMETGEMIYLANPQQMTCAVVESEYATLPPSYTNEVLAVPGVGQIGFLNAQCNTTYFGGAPGFQIWDTEPASFTPTTHKVYYTIENQSQALITLQP
jgi:hypothetical protein